VNNLNKDFGKRKDMFW